MESLSPLLIKVSIVEHGANAWLHDATCEGKRTQEDPGEEKESPIDRLNEERAVFGKGNKIRNSMLPDSETPFVPGRLTSAKYANPSRSSKLLYCHNLHKPMEQTLGTFSQLVHRRTKGYWGLAGLLSSLCCCWPSDFWHRKLTSFNCTMVIHSCAPHLRRLSPTQRQHQKNRKRIIAHRYIPHAFPE